MPRQIRKTTKKNNPYLWTSEKLFLIKCSGTNLEEEVNRKTDRCRMTQITHEKINHLDHVNKTAASTSSSFNKKVKVKEYWIMKTTRIFYNNYEEYV